MTISLLLLLATAPLLQGPAPSAQGLDSVFKPVKWRSPVKDDDR